MRIVRLNGELGKKYGRVHKLDVRTPAEAVRALCANFPGLQQDMISSQDRGVGYKCVVDREEIDSDMLSYPMSKSFSITPMVAGAGKLGRIILGVVMIAAAFALAPVTGGASLGMATPIFGTFTFASLAWMGVAVTLSGVAQLLAPTPKFTEAKKEENPYFDGAVNVTAQGSAVPVGYGRLIVGSAVISAAITVQQGIDPATAAGYDLPMMGFSGGQLV